MNTSLRLLILELLKIEKIITLHNEIIDKLKNLCALTT